jgi:hypothetical protein
MFLDIANRTPFFTLPSVEFSDLDRRQIEIEDAYGKLLYKATHSTTDDAILWVWRDLLLSSIVNSPNDTLAKKLVADIRKLHLEQQMLDRLDDQVSCA